MSVGPCEPLRLQIPRDTRFLSVVRRAAASVAWRCGFSPAEVAQIEMAVDEACANAVCHGGPQPSPHPVEVEIGLQGDELVVSISDRNEPIVRCARRVEDDAPPCERWWQHDGTGGLGLDVMARFMDAVQIGVAPGGGNRVEMRRRAVRGS